MLYQFLPEIITAVSVLIIGWSFGYWKANQDWRRKVFHNKITLTLNAIDLESKEPSLRVRTLFEKHLDEIYRSNMS